GRPWHPVSHVGSRRSGGRRSLTVRRPLQLRLGMTISRRTRRRFSDMCAANGTVRLIGDVFDEEDVRPVENYDGTESGERRREVARHEASLDLSDDRDQARLLRVYVGAISEFGRSWSGDLTPQRSRTCGGTDQ